MEMNCVETVELMKATTPADFQLEQVAHPCVKASISKWFNRVSTRDMDDMRQVACALSHIRAWTLCAQSDTPLLIAEDDIARYRKQLLANQVALEQVPNDAHVVSLVNLTSDFAIGFMRNMFDKPSTLTPVLEEFSGLQCYLLRPDGARLLLQKAMPVSMHIDRYMAVCLYSGLRLYRCGNSSIAFVPGVSTLSHSPAISWTVVFASGGVVLLLVIACIALAAALVRAKAQGRQNVSVK